MENSFFGCEPVTFKFYTQGNTHSGQTWSDGQGGTSNLDSPTFVFTSANSPYTVTIGSLSQVITVYPQLSYNLTSDSPKMGCFPFHYNLRDVTSYPPGIMANSYYWTIGDGSSHVTNPVTNKTINNFYKVNCDVTMTVTTNIPSCNGMIHIPSFFKIRDKPIAKIEANPKTSCKVPLTVVFDNLSKDSLKSTLTYLWKWNKPTAGTSTDKIPPNITFNTNLKDIVTLEVTNDVGCKSIDSVTISIDTPQFDFTLSNKVCIYDSGDLKILNADVDNFSYSFSSTAFYIARSVNDTFYRYICNNRPTGFYPYTVTKISKTDPTCKTSITKLSYIVNDRPDIYLKQDRPCKAPISDTYQVRNITKNVDSIFYFIEYRDQYSVIVKDSFFGDEKGDKINKLPKDSNLVYHINKYNDHDSFYRKGPLNIFYLASFFNKETGCLLSDTLSEVKSSIFRAYIVDYINQGCAPKKDLFKVHTYMDNKIDSVTWIWGDNSSTITKNDSTETHNYQNPGIYKAYAIVTDGKGCKDTTNPLIIKRGDSILPSFSISKTSICHNEPVVFTLNNSSNFDKWFFITDNFKSNNCPNDISNTWSNFYNTGYQKVTVIAEKNGCKTTKIDSLYVTGPKFHLNYDFKCDRRDSIYFFLTDTFEIQNLIQWDFGDGIVVSNNLRGIWHKFAGDSNNYTVKVSTTNPSGCSNMDSTVVRIRHSKPFFIDTLFCKKSFPDEILNGTPYTFNPKLSKNVDYIANYKYTWSLESMPKPGNPAKKYPPYTADNAIKVHIPEDTMMLTLIARDINGCETKFSKQIIVSDNYNDFTINKLGFCPPVANVVLTNHSSSPFGIASYKWSIHPFLNGSLSPSVFSDTFRNISTSINLITFPYDTFAVVLTITDSANCNTKTVMKKFSVFIDTSSLIIPLEICQDLPFQIFSNVNNQSIFSYKWYVNDVLIPNDTLSKLGYKFMTVGKYKVKLIKTHRLFNCAKTYEDTTYVKVKPRIRVDNTFDTVKNRCFPAITNISFYDSTFVDSLRFYFDHDGNQTTLNPSTFALHGGYNNIRTIISTNYGCLDTILNIDTVQKPDAEIQVDRPKICKGESVLFTMVNRFDVDTVHWIFGDGDEKYSTDTWALKTYKVANPNNDTIQSNLVIYGFGKVCPQTKKIPMVVLESIAQFHLNDKIDTAFCHDSFTIHNTAPRGDSFHWYMGNGKTVNDDRDSFLYWYDQPGKYTIQQYAYRKPLGCSDTAYRSLEIYPKPEISAIADSVCIGQDLSIFYTDTLANTTIQIFPDYYQNNPYSTSPILVKTNVDTTFTLYSLSDKGCKDTTTVSTIVIRPDTLMTLDTIIEMGKFVKIPFIYNTYYTYLWTPPLPNPSCINCSYPLIQGFQPDTYQITMTDYRNCFKINSKYIIDIYPDIKVSVPTAFTPNGDGINDIIYARGFGVKKLISFKIFDRQGQLIFVSNDENIGWDGYYKGTLQNSDSYYYTYKAESFIPNKFISGEGNFLLIK